MGRRSEYSAGSRNFSGRSIPCGRGPPTRIESPFARKTQPTVRALGATRRHGHGSPSGVVSARWPDAGPPGQSSHWISRRRRPRPWRAPRMDRKWPTMRKRKYQAMRFGPGTTNNKGPNIRTASPSTISQKRCRSKSRWRPPRVIAIARAPSRSSGYTSVASCWRLRCHRSRCSAIASATQRSMRSRSRACQASVARIG